MRLTYRDGTVPHINEKGNYVAAYSDRAMRDVINKLAAYEDAEEQGRLVILPCKVGDTVWQIIKYYTFGEVGDPGEENYRIEPRTFEIQHIASFGKTVFLTREEAESALAALKGATEDV